MLSIISSFNQAIIRAKQEEKDYLSLSPLIEKQKNKLNAVLALADNINPGDIGQFVSNYVDDCPRYLTAVHQLAVEKNILSYLQPFLNLCQTYFATPPDIINQSPGLASVLKKCYLCHRILEEINDQIANLTGKVLIDLDMSIPNLVAHTLIGEDLANQLDHLVLLSVETTETDKTSLNTNKHSSSSPQVHHKVSQHTLQ